MAGFCHESCADLDPVVSHSTISIQGERKNTKTSDDTHGSCKFGLLGDDTQ